MHDTITELRQVSKSEFFRTIGPLDAVIHIENRRPYISIFKTRRGRILGRIVPIDYAKQEPQKYFLA